jgi:hypothetical protein
VAFLTKAYISPILKKVNLPAIAHPRETIFSFCITPVALRHCSKKSSFSVFSTKEKQAEEQDDSAK